MANLVEYRDKPLNRWPFFLYCFCSPIIISIVQASTLDFPEVDPFFGNSYSPWPHILTFPIELGLSSVILGAIAMFLLIRGTIKIRNKTMKLLLLCFIVITTSVLMWIFLVLSQRSTVLEYLGAINANGLHFLIFFTLPLFPIMVNTNGYVPFYLTIGAGILGSIITALFYFQVYREKGD